MAAGCVLLVLALAFPLVPALDNGVGLRPPLGWSSWNHFAAKINADILKQTADSMVKHGLRDAGYQYLNLDDGWAVNRTADGVLIADPKLFPPSAPGANDGIKLVADYVHARGLKFGIYTARGSLTCLGRPGSDSHEQIDAATWATWGVDYLKEDSCGGVMHGTTYQQYSRMRDALNKTGRSIYYSITEALPHADGPVTSKMRCMGVFTVLPWVAAGKNPIDLANSYLVEYCNNYDNFGYTGGVPRTTGTLSQIDSQALLTFDNLTVSGAYNDMDMLEVCNGGQTTAEYRAAFSVWSILTSPIILGSDLRTITPECAKIILNKEVLAVNQDANVMRAPLVYQWPDRVWPAEQAGGQAEGSLRGGVGADAGPPPMTGTVAFEPCSDSPSTALNQSWSWYNNTPGPARMLKAACVTYGPACSASPANRNMCLTYGGFRESNLGLANCVGWDDTVVGGQSWLLANGSSAPSTNQVKMSCCPSKCLAAPNCAADNRTVEVCTCSGLDCGSTSCPKAMEYIVEPLPPTLSTNSAAAVGTANNNNGAETEVAAAAAVPVRIRSSLAPEQCLTAAPIPHSAMNITLQVWARPLASGAIAAVAFNRGTEAARLNVTWEMIGVPGDHHHGASRAVRDLWRHEDMGKFVGGYEAVIPPHDVVMLVVS